MGYKFFFVFKHAFFLVLLFLVINATGQGYFKEIPVIDLGFFKGNVPKNAAFASMTYIDYDYDFQIQSNKQSTEVKVKVNISPNGARSYLDRKRVKEANIDQLVEHEQGHVIIGFIIGKQVEEALNASRYTRNYKQEINANYKKFYARFEKLQLRYDEETNHGANREAQARWNREVLSKH
ncbi:DUF922 domain-containing protein [Pedobacter heparinus]|uniref:DUF922 domain-containing protein n=1 Tax=Pedobacter heparinus TaxID=984 RepID=UPI00292D49C2|nr:DUF922 domain-containing protein [Pedobacter heparinus]